MNEGRGRVSGGSARVGKQDVGAEGERGRARVRSFEREKVRTLAALHVHGKREGSVALPRRLGGEPAALPGRRRRGVVRP